MALRSALVGGRLQTLSRNKVAVEGSPPAAEGSKGDICHPAAPPCLLCRAPLTWPEPEVPSKAPRRHFIYCVFMKQPGFVACKGKGLSWGTEARRERVTEALLLCSCMPCGSSYVWDLGECRRGEISIAKKFFTDPTAKETEIGVSLAILYLPKYQLSET